MLEKSYINLTPKSDPRFVNEPVQMSIAASRTTRRDTISPHSVSPILLFSVLILDKGSVSSSR